jgi:hypothetical protein
VTTDIARNTLGGTTAPCLDLVLRNFHLFGPLKEALGGKRLEPMMRLNCAMMAGQATTSF